jgi:hypothetical protein
MHYSEAIGYKVIPINKRSHSFEENEYLKQKLFEHFGRDAIHLFPFLDGYMVIHNDPNVIREIDQRKDVAIVADILRFERIKKAVDVLQNSELKELCEKYDLKKLSLRHTKKQEDLVKIAKKLHEIIFQLLVEVTKDDNLVDL